MSSIAQLQALLAQLQLNPQDLDPELDQILAATAEAAQSRILKNDPAETQGLQRMTPSLPLTSLSILPLSKSSKTLSPKLE
jgi:hypothetical protein